MAITQEELDFIFQNTNFKDEDKKIILDFCNSFEKLFSNHVNKEELLDRIRALNTVEYEHKGDKPEAMYSQDGTLTINDDLHDNRRKAIIYHELMHLVSMHVSKTNPKRLKTQGFKMGSVNVNEIVTEYLSTLLLLSEGIEDLQGKYIISNENGVEEYVEYNGTGYINLAKLGEVYHKIFGDDLLEGYFNDAYKFQERFNSKYKFLGDEEFTPLESAINLKEHIYNNYANALRIFMTNEREKLKSGKESIYEYLKDSKLIRDCLPTRKDTNKEDYDVNGIPGGIERYLMRLDEKFVAQFIKPDIVGKSSNKDELRNKKNFYIGLNAIRDNIDYLKPEDIENINPNFVYDESSNVITISINGKSIVAHTDGETYLGTNYIDREHEQSKISKMIISGLDKGIDVEDVNNAKVEIRKS